MRFPVKIKFSKVNIALISANSVEFYPPLLNLLRDERLRHAQIICYTTYNLRIKRDKLKVKGVRFVRTSQHSSCYSIINLIERLWFVLRTLIGLIFNHPDKILYIESNSALPVYLYRRYINHNVKVFIHYYEYTSPEQYGESQWDSFCHHKERKFIYSIMDWYSQCNAKRMELFQRNCNLGPEKAHILPNYPPMSWRSYCKERHILNQPIRIIYIGSLSIENTYVCEFAEFIEQSGGKLIWDIFSYNFAKNVQTFFRKKHFKYTHIYEEGIDYDTIPQKFDSYDVGVILYKGNTPNMIYNESNKFFEYLVCGLDIWFSNRLLLLKQRKTYGTIPAVIPIDFTNLEEFNYQEAISHKEAIFKLPCFSAEEANTQLIEMLLGVNTL